ncbi:hypothetical protein FWF48_03170 [Candidatus Saccharibacteria bacterium]|nr:hypothetical protein [Candidatus Saccharibacteria bacterium]
MKQVDKISVNELQKKLKSGFRISRTRWAQFSFDEQMGNIGSEVGRAISAERRGDEKSKNGAILQGLDLLDATTEGLVKQKSPKLREVLLARDQFLALFYDNNFADADKLENYFMQFAVAARSGR